jgi:hypothetical protein
MKIEQAHIDQIRTAFEKMQSKEDLLHVLNEAKPMVYGDKAVPFQLKQLTWYANPKLGPNRYAEFKIKKKSGAERCIHAPIKGLKSLQKTLSFVLQCVYEPHNAAMGFVRDRSIVDNAKLHVGSKYVYNIDLKDFFPSVDQARVWKCLQLKPFNLNKASSVEPQHMKWEDFKKEYLKTDEPVTFIKGKGRMFTNTPYGTLYVANNFDIEKDKYILLGSSLLKTKAGKSLEGTLWLVNKIPDTSRLEIANIIASLCCTEMEVERKTENGEWEKVKRNVLPQGAPTSPVITNIVCQKMDYLLTGVAKRFGLKYSRYADDITFSSMHNVYQPESEFLKELHRIIAEQNFHIKESKTRLQKDGYRKEVTGLLVNDKANVQQRYIKQLRMWLYYWETYGYERASGFFIQQYIADKGHVKKSKPDMANVISGKLDYLKMVKGVDNELYLKLKGRCDKRIDTNIKTKTIPESEITTQADTNQVKITLEVYHSPEKNEKLKTSINIPKDTVLPSTIIVPNSNLEVEVITIKDESIYPIIHNPSTTVSLLKYFTANDKNLKYSTHSWEEGKYDSYEDFLSKISFEWNEIKDEIKKQSKRLHAKISSFLFNNKLGKKNEIGFYEVWGENRLKFGWSSEELIIHMSEAGNSPFSCPIPEHIKQLDKKYNLHYFKDYAEVFKNEIEFREDSNNFKKMILDIWENELGYDYKLNGLEQLVGFSLFTDVALVKASVVKIFEMFKGKPHYPVISVEKNSSFENRGYHLFTITQIDSFVTRSIDDPKITNPSGNLNTIIEQLKNLSDYSIVSRFQDGNTYRINYLSSSTTSEFIVKLPDDETALGITHELKFYL